MAQDFTLAAHPMILQWQVSGYKKLKTACIASSDRFMLQDSKPAETTLQTGRGHNMASEGERALKGENIMHRLQ